MFELQIIKDFFAKLDFEVKIEKFIVHEALSDITFKLNGEVVYAEIRKEVRPNHLPIFLGEAKHYTPNAYLVAADYITPKSKEALKMEGINYIDGFGNAFIDLEGLKIFIEHGNAKPIYNVYSEVFTRAGGQILFHLLQDPEKINTNYEVLAEISCVSLGSVGKTMKGLKKEGYAIKQDSKEYQLVKREELLEKWVTLLNEKILPTHKIGTYRFSGPGAFEIKDTDSNFETLWGGESGAASLTGFLVPEKFSLFTNRSKQDLLKLRIIPDEEGMITAYTSFWKPESNLANYEDNDVIAPPLLIYAQLIYSGNSRNIETAKIIFDEYIKPNL